MDNYDDIFQNNDDGIGDNVRLDDDTIRDHAIHDEKYDKFLVPIYLKENEESSLNGNGVIVDKYLITAAHVAYCDKLKMKIPQLFYKFNGEWCKVSDNMLVHDGREVPDKDGIHDDLVIYKLDKHYADSFALCGNNLQNGEKMMLKPYRINEGDNCAVANEFVDCFNWNEKIIENRILINCWSNCFIVNAPAQIQKGDSGSAIFCQNKLYGILIKGDETGKTRYCMVLKSDYISQMIQRKDVKIWKK